MPRVHTHYDNLKVARNAPPEVIRAAYRTLSKKYHPDHNSNSAESIRIIQLINAAYEVLSDPAKRDEHDRWIARMEAGDAAHHHGWNNSEGHGPNSYARPQARSRSSTATRSRQPHYASVAAQRLIYRMQYMLDQFARFLSKKA
jgi:DnaJ-class molecular chaperone